MGERALADACAPTGGFELPGLPTPSCRLFLQLELRVTAARDGSLHAEAEELDNAALGAAAVRTEWVGSWLRVEGEVSRREGARKVWVTARLVAPAAAGGDEVVHCTAEGLFVLKKRV